MQSSYSLIKNAFAKDAGNRVITTEYVRKNVENEVITEETKEEEVKEPQIDPEELLKRYEEIGKRIIEDAQVKRKELLLNAEKEASNTEKEAYEKGYSQGTQNGYEDGYKKAYDETIEIAKTEAADIVEKAEKLLKSAQSEYNEYLEVKKTEIIELALNIAENIARKELSNDDSINLIIEEAFRISKGEESVIIRANSIHEEQLKANCKKWQISYDIKKDIFVIADDSMEPGNAILEKTSGVVKVGIDIGLEQVKKAIFG